MLASQHYKWELKEVKEEKVRSEQSLKRKAKCEELEKLRRKKGRFAGHHQCVKKFN